MGKPKYINLEWIYVASCPYTYSEKTKRRLIKIGYTQYVNPENRMIGLNRTGSPAKPEIIAAILVDKSIGIEKIMHNILGMFRIPDKEFFEILPEQALSQLSYFQMIYNAEEYNKLTKYDDIEFNPDIMTYNTKKEPEEEPEPEPDDEEPETESDDLEDTDIAFILFQKTQNLQLITKNHDETEKYIGLYNYELSTTRKSINIIFQNREDHSLTSFADSVKTIRKRAGPRYTYVELDDGQIITVRQLVINRKKFEKLFFDKWGVKDLKQ